MIPVILHYVFLLGNIQINSAKLIQLECLNKYSKREKENIEKENIEAHFVCDKIKKII